MNNDSSNCAKCILENVNIVAMRWYLNWRSMGKNGCLVIVNSEFLCETVNTECWPHRDKKLYTHLCRGNTLSAIYLLHWWGNNMHSFRREIWKIFTSHDFEWAITWHNIKLPRWPSCLCSRVNSQNIKRFVAQMFGIATSNRLNCTRWLSMRRPLYGSLKLREVQGFSSWRCILGVALWKLLIDLFWSEAPAISFLILIVLFQENWSDWKRVVLGKRSQRASTVVRREG